MFTNQPLLIFIALSTVVAVFGILQTRRKRTPTEILFCLALGFFIMTGVIQPERAWAGFADKSVVMIAGLLVISAALRTSGVLDKIGERLLGSATRENQAMSRTSGILIAGSAFLLNTAIVAMLMPLVINWCRRNTISPSRLLLPMSYLAILGGTCTLVGTSTNLVVNTKLEELHQIVQQSEASGVLPESMERYNREWLNAHASDFRAMNMFDITPVGLPCAMCGALLILFAGRWLLPDRSELLESLGEKRREYLVEMMVTANCVLIGKTVEEGGLRSLPGLYLIEIDREGEVIGPVDPLTKIHENDRLVFTGVVATIVDLEKIPGLLPAADINYEIVAGKPGGRSLVEVVLSPSSPLVGKTIRNANFRQLYGAAVVAVHRNGERLPTKLGDIELAPGDTLLLQTQGSFIRAFRNRPDFYLISDVDASDSRRRHDKLKLAGGIAVGLILWLVLTPVLPMLLAPLYGTHDDVPTALISPTAAIFAAALAMILTRCISVADARASLDLPLLLTIGAAIGVGNALYDCGAANFVAETLVGLVGQSPYLGLIVVFIITVCLTEMVSNVAVAAVMVYVAIELASNLGPGGVSPRPFIMAVTMAASLSFVSPIGYQTNLMVMGPGGYRPRDYLRAGLPLSILVSIVALILIPLIWPF